MTKIAARYAMALLAILLCACMSGSTEEARFRSKYTLMLFDDETEQYFGHALNRGDMAEVIRRVDRAHAKAIVLKFFFEVEKDSADAALASAIQSASVILQASLAESAAQDNGLPDRYLVPHGMLSIADHPVTFAGQFPLTPIPALSSVAADVCSVDVPLLENQLPVFQEWRGRGLMKSAFVCALQAAEGAAVRVISNKVFAIGSKCLEMNESLAIPTRGRTLRRPERFPMADWLRNGAGESELNGKVVVLGYAGSKAPVVMSGLTTHEAFFAALREFESAVNESAGVPCR